MLSGIFSFVIRDVTIEETCPVICKLFLRMPLESIGLKVLNPYL